MCQHRHAVNDSYTFIPTCVQYYDSHSRSNLHFQKDIGPICPVLCWYSVKSKQWYWNLVSIKPDHRRRNKKNEPYAYIRKEPFGFVRVCQKMSCTAHRNTLSFWYLTVTLSVKQVRVTPGTQRPMKLFYHILKIYKNS